MNNIFIDSWFKQCAMYKAKSLSDEKVIFGGKKLFFERMKNRITKEEFKIKKLLLLYVIGESNYYGNRKFDFQIIENNKLIFKPCLKTKIELQLPKLRKNYQKILFKLEQATNDKLLPVTIALDLDFIYITFDENFLKQEIASKVKNRIMTLDLNPNYIGFSVIDWKSEDSKSIIKTSCISIKQLNDKQFELKDLKVSSEDSRMKYLVNKRVFETFEVAKYLVNMARQYHVESFGIEDLTIKSSEKGKGSKYNRLVNNLWNRGKLVSNIEKRLNICGIKLYKILPQYSSFVGNIMNRQYFDPIASSIEISRRCYCFKNKIKPVLFPDFKKSISVITKSLEEFSDNVVKLVDIKDWRELYRQVKSLKLKYRVSLSDKLKVFRLFNKKSLCEFY
jgi:IS605 OrfB family transposase